jgi:hypothetical protein
MVEKNHFAQVSGGRPKALEDDDRANARFKWRIE